MHLSALLFLRTTLIWFFLLQYQHNPWAAPGSAPVADACGLAGGSPSRQNGAEAGDCKILQPIRGFALCEFARGCIAVKA